MTKLWILGFDSRAIDPCSSYYDAAARARVEQGGFPAVRPTLRYLFRPASVAVIGRMANPQAFAMRAVKALDAGGFPGEIHPIDISHRDIIGRGSSQDGLLLPKPVDLVIVSAKADLVPPVLERCGREGVKAAIIVSGGFEEASNDRGESLAADIRSIAQKYGIAVCGPNTAGIVSLHSHLVATINTAFVPESQSKVLSLPGTVAVVSQSGGVLNAIYSDGTSRGLAFHSLVGSGNETVITQDEYISYLVSDPDARVVLCYVEQIRNWPAFLAACAAARERDKYVVVLKVGRSSAGRAAARAHTGALSGSGDVVRSALRAHGVIVVDDLSELVDVASALVAVGSGSLPRSSVGIFSQVGGGAALAADSAEEHGFSVPQLSSETRNRLSKFLHSSAHAQNPLDPIGGFASDPERFRGGLEAFALDEAIDAIVFVAVQSSVAGAEQLSQDISYVARKVRKPIFCVWLGNSNGRTAGVAQLAKSGIPVFFEVSDLFGSLSQARLASAEPIISVGTRHQFPTLVKTRTEEWDPETAGTWLREAGIPMPPSKRATDPAELLTFVQDQRVAALKISWPGLDHKSDLGAIRLNVTEANFEGEYHSLVELARQHRPEGDWTIDAQAMLAQGLEILVSGFSDVEIGPVITLAAGGTLTELMDDSIVVPAPLRPGEVYRTLRELRIFRLLDGYRGTAKYDTAALVDLICVASVAAGSLEGTDRYFELNPVIVLSDGAGAFAVDVLVGRSCDQL